MFRLARKLALVALAAVMAAASVATAATSGTVNLSGTVASTLAVTAVATAAATTLDLGGLGGAQTEKIVMVGDLTGTTNNSSGLTFTITSGNLVNGTATTPIAYKVTTVADAATAPLTGVFTVASGTSYTFATSVGGVDLRDLYVAYTPASLQDPGTYTATITVTVADN